MQKPADTFFLSHAPGLILKVWGAKFGGFQVGFSLIIQFEPLVVVRWTAASEPDICLRSLCGSYSLWLHLSASIVCRGPSAGLQCSPSSHIRLSPSLLRQQTPSNLTPPPIAFLSASPGKPAVPLFLSPVPLSLMFSVWILCEGLLVQFRNRLTSHWTHLTDVVVQLRCKLHLFVFFH